MIDVTAAPHLSGHRLEIEFSDGSARIVDFGPFLRASQHPDIRIYLDPDKLARWFWLALRMVTAKGGLA